MEFWKLIDSRTVMIASAIVCGSFAPMMYLTMRGRKMFPGFGWWAASIILYSAELILEATHGVLPHTLTVCMGNLFSISVLMLAAEGVRRFCDRPSVPKWLLGYTAVIYLGQLYFVLVHDSLRLRVLWMGPLVLPLFVYAAWPMLGPAPEGRRFGYRITGGLLLFSSTQILLPFLAALSGASPAMAASQPSATEVIYSLILMLFTSGFAFSFFVLVLERQAAELKVAHQALVADAEERLHMTARLAEAERLESIGRLAGGISHIFNNQMCIVQLNCEHLRSVAEIPEPLQQNLRRIAEAAERAAKITGRLQQFARARALHNTTFDLARWLEAQLPVLRRVLGEAVDVRCEILVRERAAMVHADVTQLGAVLQDLAGNARDAMPQGGSWQLRLERLHLTQERGEELGLASGEYLLLSTIDRGCGMDEETLKRIFEPFYSSHGLAVADGLGLSTAFGMAQQSGGTITAASTLGAGTTISLYLPAAP